LGPLGRQSKFPQGQGLLTCQIVIPGFPTGFNQGNWWQWVDPLIPKTFGVLIPWGANHSFKGLPLGKNLAFFGPGSLAFNQGEIKKIASHMT